MTSRYRLLLRRLISTLTFLSDAVVYARIAFVLVIVLLFLLASTAPELAHPSTKKYPPNVRAYIRIAQCEQPAPTKYKQGNRWPSAYKWGVWWHQKHNYSFAGGGGMQTYLWTAHRRKSAAHIKSMADASIEEQLWSMHRLYQWAERTYPGAGYTAWDCANKKTFQ